MATCRIGEKSWCLGASFAYPPHARSHAREWNRVFVDDKLTAALLDRLAQHADVLVTRGPGDRGPAQSKDAQELAGHADARTTRLYVRKQRTLRRREVDRVQL